MPEEKPDPSEMIEASKITIVELVRSQLEGKLKALDRYDYILWKIRSGYIVVLYGLFTILLGKDFELPQVIGIDTMPKFLLYLATGISICALFIDLGFLLSKLRVVHSRNQLSDLALDLAHCESSENREDELRPLLHLSGEELTRPPLSLIVSGSWSIIFLYFSTPGLLCILISFS